MFLGYELCINRVSNILPVKTCLIDHIPWLEIGHEIFWVWHFSYLKVKRKSMIRFSRMDTLTWSSSVYISVLPNLWFLWSVKTLTIFSEGSTIQYSLIPACSYLFNFSTYGSLAGPMLNLFQVRCCEAHRTEIYLTWPLFHSASSCDHPKRQSGHPHRRGCFTNLIP